MLETILDGKIGAPSLSCPVSRQYLGWCGHAVLGHNHKLLNAGAGRSGEQLVSECNLFVIVLRNCLRSRSEGSPCTE